jgi:hypothetical protein
MENNFMICIQNKGYEVSLEKGKVYHVKEDTEAKKGNIFPSLSTLHAKRFTQVVPMGLIYGEGGGSDPALRTGLQIFRPCGFINQASLRSQITYHVSSIQYPASECRVPSTE